MTSYLVHTTDIHHRVTRRIRRTSLHNRLMRPTLHTILPRTHSFILSLFLKQTTSFSYVYKKNDTKLVHEQNTKAYLHCWWLRLWWWMYKTCKYRTASVNAHIDSNHEGDINPVFALLSSSVSRANLSCVATTPFPVLLFFLRPSPWPN